MTKIADYSRQPDGLTCQAAAIAKVLGNPSAAGVGEVRRALLSMGIPGDPAVMGAYMRTRVAQYRFDSAASLSAVAEWVSQGAGYECITHGWFTGSGHVIGVEDVVGWETPHPAFRVDDPWAEFSFSTGLYVNRSGANVAYSALGMWAYCVASYSYTQANTLYRQAVASPVAWFTDVPTNAKVNALETVRNQANAWVHFIRN